MQTTFAAAKVSDPSCKVVYDAGSYAFKTIASSGAKTLLSVTVPVSALKVKFSLTGSLGMARAAAECSQSGTAMYGVGMKLTGACMRLFVCLTDAWGWDEADRCVRVSAVCLADAWGWDEAGRCVCVSVCVPR